MAGEPKKWEGGSAAYSRYWLQIMPPTQEDNAVSVSTGFTFAQWMEELMASPSLFHISDITTHLCEDGRPFEKEYSHGTIQLVFKGLINSSPLKMIFLSECL